MSPFTELGGNTFLDNLHDNANALTKSVQKCTVHAMLELFGHLTCEKPHLLYYIATLVFGLRHLLCHENDENKIPIHHVL